MFTLLFNREEVEAYRLEEYDRAGFEHTFGGEACHDGATPPDCPRPVHLFYLLDLADPRLGIRFPNRRVKRLPLYYPLGNCGGPFRYRVLSNRRIEMLCHPYPKRHRGAAFFRDYPDPFPRTRIELDPIGYNPKDPDDVDYCGGLLGVAALSPRQKAALKKQMELTFLTEYGEELVDEGGRPYPTLDALAAECNPFTQGMPEDTCPNPACANHKAGDPLPVLLFIRPDPEDDFYELIAGGDSGQLIFQFCQKCGSVVVNNPCT